MVIIVWVCQIYLRIIFFSRIFLNAILLINLDNPHCNIHIIWIFVSILINAILKILYFYRNLDIV